METCICDVKWKSTSYLLPLPYLHIPDAQIKHPTTVQDQDSSEANPSIKGTRE